ncbi:MAG: hypothetical protein ACNI3A_16315 [Desulfovibrio sp.]|uniref:hypothetical protein n=1 Tax=Desulfovibrio sp. 7SRBS1 TaxID=3378064 RepID=UPI003B3C86AB
MPIPQEHPSKVFILREAEASPDDLAETAPRLVLQALLRHRTFIGLLTLGTTLLAFAATFLIPTAYQSRASLLIPKTTRLDVDGTSTSAGLLERLLPAENKKYKEQTILAFLHSAALARRIIPAENLLPLLYRAPLDRLVLGLRRSLGSGRGGRPSLELAVQEDRLGAIFQAVPRLEQPVIDLTMLADTPERAQALLGRTIELLSRYLQHEYISDAGRERRHLEELCTRAEADLSRWEKATPNGQTDRMVIQRNLLTARKVHLELRLRLAAARAEEARQEVDFKLMDTPSLPVLADRPHRIRVAAVAFLVALFAACGLALLREGLTDRSSLQARPKALKKSASE